MLNTWNLGDFSSHITVDQKNKRLIINGYTQGIKPSLFSAQLIDLAIKNRLEKIWLWALPADVPEFIQGGFCTEGNIFRGYDKEFSVSIAYYVSRKRAYS
ncbi:MAG: putative beta-lysine N-acetyltransferase, partial [Desulfosporosinus sp.]|nr:putative beta-lysine N-acetyltransferase [Desulfosporosinus sp.]